MFRGSQGPHALSNTRDSRAASIACSASTRRCAWVW